MANQSWMDCIKACDACATECESCATSCLGEAEVKRLSQCIALDRDCADVCRLASALMSRGSPFAKQLCMLCATVCEACAAECEKHSAMDHCRICAEVCRRCAAECRRMAA
jgi:hypothetical protein